MAFHRMTEMQRVKLQFPLAPFPAQRIRPTIEGVFQSILDVKDQPEAEQICMFLKSAHSNPRVVEVKNPAPFANYAGDQNPNDERHIGDILKTGRKLQLHSIQLQGGDDIKNLQKLILSFGRLYKQAQIFDIKPLMVDFIQKLQISWNSYPDFYQLQPMIEVVRIIDPVHLIPDDYFLGMDCAVYRRNV